MGYRSLGLAEVATAWINLSTYGAQSWKCESSIHSAYTITKLDKLADQDSAQLSVVCFSHRANQRLPFQ